MGKMLEQFGEVRIIDETNGFDWTLSRRQRVDFGAPPQTWEQYSKEGRIWDLYIDRRLEDEKNPRALARKPSF